MGGLAAVGQDCRFADVESTKVGFPAVVVALRDPLRPAHVLDL